MSNNSIGIVKTEYFTFAQDNKKLILESGEKLGPITVAYETYGKINKAKDNAILVVHALSGDAHAAGLPVAAPHGKPAGGVVCRGSPGYAAGDARGNSPVVESRNG